MSIFHFQVLLDKIDIHFDALYIGIDITVSRNHVYKEMTHHFNSEQINYKKITEIFNNLNCRFYFLLNLF